MAILKIYKQKNYLSPLNTLIMFLDNNTNSSGSFVKTPMPSGPVAENSVWAEVPPVAQWLDMF